MIYEWRVYEIIPGKRRQLNDRFANHTVGLFKKHGMEVVGFWESVIGGRTNTLYYMLGFKNLAHREDAWKSFSSDPEWEHGPPTHAILPNAVTPFDSSNPADTPSRPSLPPCKPSISTRRAEARVFKWRKLTRGAKRV
jgi:NIPSNAP